MKNINKVALLTLLLSGLATFCHGQKTLRLGIAGLNHDHVHGVLNQYHRGQVNIVGIAEPNTGLWKKYAKLYNLPDSLFFLDLKKMIEAKKPEVILGYNEVASHVNIVKICAPLHIPVMVEKPLSANLEQAKQIEALANQYHIQVLTNYETTWYPSYYDVYQTVARDSIGSIKKIVVHDGHQGPKEIGCSPEFLTWLTDPVLNGAGPLNDFGCYGADLMTWFMQGKKPIAVTAITRHYKPSIYPKVEDDATILLEYPGAMGQIEASWNWPFSIKDLEIFGEHGYLHALDGTHITSRMRENIKGSKIASALQIPINEPLIYLTAVLQNKIMDNHDQSSLKYNMVVMEILDAAKRSAAEGKRIVLSN